MKYTTTFKKAVLRKVLPPENRSVHSVSKEMGVGEITIHRWISQIKDGTLNLEQDEGNPSGQRNMTEKLTIPIDIKDGIWLDLNDLVAAGELVDINCVDTVLASQSFRVKSNVVFNIRNEKENITVVI